VWRQEDEALFERLENETVLERLWRLQAGDTAPPPHPRAAGMIRLLRGAPGGEPAINEALAGRFEPLFARLLPARLNDQPPELLHHIALYYARLADALAATSPEPAIHARIQALAAWIVLGEEKKYLRTLAAAIAGSALSDEDIERAASNAAIESIDDLARIAREGANELTEPSALALATLSRIQDACRIAACAPATAQNIARRAERARAVAAEEAIAPIQEALSEAAARGDILAKAPDLFLRLASAWKWACEEEAVEAFAIEQITPLAWDIQRESRWDQLRRLLSPIFPLVERLAYRIESDPTRIAYAGPCAQIYVFRVEMENDLEQRLAYGERAVKLCPSHRNGRLVLASALCDKAVKLITATGWAATPGALDTAEALVLRAEKLFPDLKKLEDVKKRVAESRRLAGAHAR